MLIAFWVFNWDEWLLNHKVVFDGPNKLIYIAPSVDTIDIQVDLYSAWKEWMIVSEQAGGAMKWDAAFTVSGGEPLPSGDPLGRTFFLINGWRILLDHGIRFIGNLFTDTGDSPFVIQGNTQIAISEVSALVVERTGAVAASALAEAVWDRAITDLTTAGSVGELITTLRDASILVNTTVSAAADPQNITLSASGIADGFYNDHFIQITDGTRFVVGLIEDWSNTGDIILSEPLPFTPTVGATALLLAQRHIGSGRIR